MAEKMVKVSVCLTAHVALQNCIENDTLFI